MLLGNHIRYQHIYRVQEYSVCLVFTVVMSSFLRQRYFRSFYVCFLRYSEVFVHYTHWSLSTECCTAKHFCEHLNVGFFLFSRIALIRKLVIRIANNPDRLGPSGKFVENSAKLTCLEITGYRVKYSTVLWLIELQIGRGQKV